MPARLGYASAASCFWVTTGRCFKTGRSVTAIRFRGCHATPHGRQPSRLDYFREVLLVASGFDPAVFVPGNTGARSAFSPCQICPVRPDWIGPPRHEGMPVETNDRNGGGIKGRISKFGRRL